MSPFLRTTVLGLVALAGAGVYVFRPEPAPQVPPAASAARRPRIVELGSTSCRSCQAMHAELAQLRQECGDRLAVEEIDVWRDEGAAARYGVRVIPTQVLFDADGREIDRHVGYLARSDIRARFARQGLACAP